MRSHSQRGRTGIGLHACGTPDLPLTTPHLVSGYASGTRHWGSCSHGAHRLTVGVRQVSRPWAFRRQTHRRAWRVERVGEGFPQKGECGPDLIGRQKL